MLFVSFIHSLFYHIHHDVWLWLTTNYTNTSNTNLHACHENKKKLIEQTQV